MNKLYDTTKNLAGKFKKSERPIRDKNNNNITSMALKSSEARAQKHNKTKSVIILKSRGHTGIIISFKGPPTI